jgi:hypothetical protein
MRALYSKSAKSVNEALLLEPDAAHFPFWDHEVEPPLCFAVRHMCGAEITRLLLEHGADPAMTDKYGRTPADIMRSMATSGRFKDSGSVEQLLRLAKCYQSPDQSARVSPTSAFHASL